MDNRELARIFHSFLVSINGSELERINRMFFDYTTYITNSDSKSLEGSQVLYSKNVDVIEALLNEQPIEQVKHLSDRIKESVLHGGIQNGKD